MPYGCGFHGYGRRRFYGRRYGYGYHYPHYGYGHGYGLGLGGLLLGLAAVSSRDNSRRATKSKASSGYRSNAQASPSTSGYQSDALAGQPRGSPSEPNHGNSEYYGTSSQYPTALAPKTIGPQDEIVPREARQNCSASSQSQPERYPEVMVVECGHCNKLMQVFTNLPPGTSIVCPHCQQQLMLPRL